MVFFFSRPWKESISFWFDLCISNSQNARFIALIFIAHHPYHVRYIDVMCSALCTSSAPNYVTEREEERENVESKYTTYVLSVSKLNYPTTHTHIHSHAQPNTYTVHCQQTNEQLMTMDKYNHCFRFVAVTHETMCIERRLVWMKWRMPAICFDIRILTGTGTHTLTHVRPKSYDELRIRQHFVYDSQLRAHFVCYALCS